MRREGGVVGLRDPGCLVVFGFLERLLAVGAVVFDSIGGGRVCAIFVVASCVADAVIVNTAIRGAIVVVVVQIAVGNWVGKLRAGPGCYEEVRDSTGLLPVILTISVAVHCGNGKTNVQPRRSRQ